MDSIVYEIAQSSGATDQSIFLQKNWIIFYCIENGGT